MEEQNPKKPWLFQKGQSGNPKGRPKGSKNALAADFFKRLQEDFERFGIYAIARARRDDPLGYVKVVASLMPKELDVRHSEAEMTSDELDRYIARLREALNSGTGVAAGPAESAGESAGQPSSVH